MLCIICMIIHFGNKLAYVLGGISGKGENHQESLKAFPMQWSPRQKPLKMQKTGKMEIPQSPPSTNMNTSRSIQYWTGH